MNRTALKYKHIKLSDMTTNDYNNMMDFLKAEKEFELAHNIIHGGAYCAYTMLSNITDNKMIYILFITLEDTIININWKNIVYYITIFISNSLRIYNPMGIFKAMKYKTLYYGLSISLHSYAAHIALTINPKIKYMMTSPNFIMSSILISACKNYKKKIIILFKTIHNPSNPYKRFAYIKSILFMRLVLKNINNNNKLKYPINDVIYLTDIYNEIIGSIYEGEIFAYENYPMDYDNYNPYNCKCLTDKIQITTVRELILYFFGSEKFIREYIQRDKLLIVRNINKKLYNQIINTKFSSIDIIDKLLKNKKFHKMIPCELYKLIFNYDYVENENTNIVIFDNMWSIDNYLHNKPRWWDIYDKHNNRIPCFTSSGLVIIIKASDLNDLYPLFTNSTPIRYTRSIK